MKHTMCHQCVSADGSRSADGEGCRAEQGGREQGGAAYGNQRDITSAEPWGKRAKSAQHGQASNTDEEWAGANWAGARQAGAATDTGTLHARCSGAESGTEPHGAMSAEPWRARATSTPHGQASNTAEQCAGAKCAGAADARRREMHGMEWARAADERECERRRAGEPGRPPGAAATGRPPPPWLVPGNPNQESSRRDSNMRGRIM